MEITREYLQYLESKGEGKINWDAWDRLIEEGRKWNAEHFPSNTPNDHRVRKTIYGYDNNGELVKQWQTNKECAVGLGCSTSTVHNYSILKNVINNYLLSREKLLKDVAFALYKESLHHGKVYQQGVSKTKKPKTLYIYNEYGKMIGIYDNVSQYCKRIGIDSHNIRHRMRSGDIIRKGVLLSYSFYDDYTAYEAYNSIKNNKQG